MKLNNVDKTPMLDGLKQQLNNIMVDNLTRHIVDAAVENFRSDLEKIVRAEVEKYTVEKLTLFNDHISAKSGFAVSVQFSDELIASVHRG